MNIRVNLDLPEQTIQAMQREADRQRRSRKNLMENFLIEQGVKIIESDKKLKKNEQATRS